MKTQKTTPVFSPELIFETGQMLAEAEKELAANPLGAALLIGEPLAMLCDTIACKGAPELRRQPGDKKLTGAVEIVRMMLDRLHAFHTAQLALQPVE